MKKVFKPSNDAKQRKLEAATSIRKNITASTNVSQTAKQLSETLLDFLGEMPDDVVNYLGEDAVAEMGEVANMLQDIADNFEGSDI